MVSKKLTKIVMIFVTKFGDSQKNVTKFGEKNHTLLITKHPSVPSSKSRLPKLLKLANVLGILSSSDVCDKIFLPLGQGKRQIFHWGTG